MHQALREQLLSLAKKDQVMRKKGKWRPSVDRANTQKLKNIVRKYGWPDIPLVGKRGSHAAWLIVQHADHDVEFQKYCLGLMRKKLKEGKISPQDVAYLADRIRVHRGLPQLYGTQFYLKDGKLVPYPIYGRKQLAARRRKYHLKPFREYMSKMLRLHNQITKRR